MIAQFDSPAGTPTLACLPTTNTIADSVEQIARELPHATGTSQPVSAPLLTRFIDWNLHHPDGTDVALQELLKHCGDLLGAEVIVGRTLPSGGIGLIISSNRVWSRAQSSAKFDASILEASLAQHNFLVATEDNHNSGVLNCLRQTGQYGSVIGFALKNATCPLELPLGVLICQSQSSSNSGTSLGLLPQLQAELSAWLHTWQACRNSSTQQTWANTVARLKKYRRALLLGCAVATTLLVFAPAPYWPQRECIVEPSARRFVASPIDGRVLRSLVRPGDVVAAGQVIGQLDDEHLRWEIGAAEAEMQAAQKHRDSALAHKEGGKLRLAQFEQQQIALKIQSLQSQLQQLELRSPSAGIVLQGEWFRSEGAPVARGDTLFEIAPLEHMTIEVHLKTEDLGEINVGDTVTVRVDSAFGTAWSGTISRIDPRAAVIDDKVCFVADVEVDNADNRLRPGMQGTVRISTGFKSIGWLIFHRPYRWLMKNLVW